MIVGHWTVTWTLIPFGWYIGKITGMLMLGLVLEYLKERSMLCCTLGGGCSEAAYSALPGGGGAFCYGHASVLWYADVRLHGKLNSPGETQDVREVGVSPGRD